MKKTEFLTAFGSTTTSDSAEPAPTTITEPTPLSFGAALKALCDNIQNQKYWYATIFSEYMKQLSKEDLQKLYNYSCRWGGKTMLVSSSLSQLEEAGLQLLGDESSGLYHMIQTEIQMILNANPGLYEVYPSTPATKPAPVKKAM